MRIVLEYRDETEGPLGREFFERVAERTFAAEGEAFLLGKDELRVSVAAVGAERIRELNRTYRGKDAPTDILSFGEYADREALAGDGSRELFLGEIVFCPAVIETAAREDGVSFRRELAYVFAHGVLHLIGYDHEERMFALQDAVTDSGVVE